MPSYILALDQGTTSSRAIVFDESGRPIASRGHEFTQVFPRPGWVEHDPLEIWNSQMAATQDVLDESGISTRDILAIGITNQRETTVVWNRSTGEPIHNAIVWQCRRTAGLCDQLKSEGLESTVREKTGLLIDAYFSGTKIRWLLDNVPGARKRAERGELAFGTVDSWLTFRLSNGSSHVTDPSNASRTMLYNIHDGDWDNDLLDTLKIPRELLPEVVHSSGYAGEADVRHFGRRIPIMGIAGDQQAALFGQRCFEPGQAKNTYGTGCFLLMQTGDQPVSSQGGLLTTIAWDTGSGPRYALEGSVFVAGAVIQWLRDQLELIKNAADTSAIADSVEDTGGMYLVPAFVGLGAPIWDMHARGTMVGMTRGTNRAHIVRAALESIAFQTRDVADAMVHDLDNPMTSMRVDGGASANQFLMQFQADILGVPVYRPAIAESTARGAALLGGLGAGLWKDEASIPQDGEQIERFYPAMPSERRTALYDGWLRAVERCRDWATTDD